MVAFEGLYNAHLYAFLTRTNLGARRIIIIEIFGDLFNWQRKRSLKIKSSFLYSDEYQLAE